MLLLGMEYKLRYSTRSSFANSISSSIFEKLNVITKKDKSKIKELNHIMTIHKEHFKLDSCIEF